jgi:hypothetical protein
MTLTLELRSDSRPARRTAQDGLRRRDTDRARPRREDGRSGSSCVAELQSCRAAHDRADKFGPCAGGGQAGGLPQGRRGIGGAGAAGVCLFAKRLEDGKFRWPIVQDAVMRLSAAELSALLVSSPDAPASWSAA